MTDMRPRRTKVFGPRFMLAMLLAAFATFAQEENDVDDLDPAIDTSVSVERDESELPVSRPMLTLAAEVERQRRDSEVMDRMQLGLTEITGNQELPKVLYIVPWQKSDPSELLDRPLNSLLDEVLAPVDREEFIRQVDYYGDLYGEEE